MTFTIITPDAARWDAFVEGHPDAHLLQRTAWGQHQSRFGWTPRTIAVQNDSGQIVAGALALYRRLPMRLGRRGYIPAGPLFADPDPAHPANSALWKALRGHAAYLKVEPCNWYRPRPDLPAQLTAAGLQPSPETIQPPRTIVIDLSPPEADILARMNQSTRYKSKLGPKKEVVVREGTRDDMASFNRLMQITGARDEFGIRSPEYYTAAYDLFVPSGHGALLMASYNGQDLAGLMVFRCGPTAYYLYGASSNEERNRMPTYIVQWEAIRWAKRQGALYYDMWGVPDEDEPTLEAQFEGRGDGLWGVYGFKRGFGGEVRRSIGAWDKVYNPIVYALYRWYLARRGRSHG